MTTDEFIFNALTSDSGLSALWPRTGGLFLDTAPQTGVNGVPPFPYTVFQRIGGKPTVTLEGDANLDGQIYSFSTFSIGTATQSGSMEANAITQEIKRVLNATSVIGTFTAAVCDLLPICTWLEEERAYRSVISFEVWSTIG